MRYLYVEDKLIFFTSLVQVHETLQLMKNTGEANVILGIEIIRDGSQIKLSQSHYIEKLLSRFGILETLAISSPTKQSMKFAKTYWTTCFTIGVFKDHRIFALCYDMY